MIERRRRKCSWDIGRRRRRRQEKEKNFAVCDVIIKVYTQDEGVDQHPQAEAYK